MTQDLDLFKPYLKAFATGPKGNRDLSFDEAYEATRFVLNQSIPPEVVGAFLMTWRVKIETDEELLGALKALKEDEIDLSVKTNSIEISFALEGKKKNIPLIFLSAKFLPKEHFVLTVSNKQTENSLLNLQEHLPSNVSLINRQSHLPKLEALQNLRDNLGQRSIFNTLEKLHHPLKSDYAVIGAHHGPYFKKYAKIFSSQYKKLMIVQGDEGCGEIIKRSKIEIIQKGEVIESFTLNAKDYGIDFQKPDTKLSLEDMINQLKNPSEAHMKMAKLNAALYLYLKEGQKSIEEYYLSL